MKKLFISLLMFTAICSASIANWSSNTSTSWGSGGPSIPVVATTPEAYKLSTALEGSQVYVTSAHKLYVRGVSTWEIITSAP